MKKLLKYYRMIKGDGKMEKEWIEVAELQRVKNLVTEEETINESKKMWDEILKQYNIDYKFEIVEDTEYSMEDVRFKGQLQNVYILKIYTTKENLKLIKSIIHEYAQDYKKEEPKREEYEENEYEPAGVKFGRYFIIIVMLLALILEIGLMVSAKEAEVSGYVAIGIFIIIELYIIKKFSKKRGKKKR